MTAAIAAAGVRRHVDSHSLSKTSEQSISRRRLSGTSMPSSNPGREEKPMSTSDAAQCPYHHAAGGGTTNRDWWPNQLRVDLLNQHADKSNPLGRDFDYAKAFKSLTTRR